MDQTVLVTSVLQTALDHDGSIIVQTTPHSDDRVIIRFADDLLELDFIQTAVAALEARLYSAVQPAVYVPAGHAPEVI